MIKKHLSKFLFAVSLLVFSTASHAVDVKEWTVLVFLNGHNNLDSFGTLNMNQMKEIGSTDKVNIVVQWASLKNKNTKRILVKKGSFEVIETLPPVDMGDYKSLIEFARWTHERYPAKKYMIDIWNHGNGWHKVENVRGGFQISDISYDDKTGHKITTEELGSSMREIAKLTGQKVELYASDACLMAMGEVAGEMTDSVKFFAGSQETEPGEGWPYNKFLDKLVAKPDMDGGELAKILAKEYKAAYSGGIYGKKEVTFSAYDLSKMDKFYDVLRGITADLKNLDSAALKTAFSYIKQTQSYALEDYKDFSDYMTLVGKLVNLSDVRAESLRGAISDLIIANEVTNYYAKSHGLSIWLPESKYDWDDYGTRYKGLEFHKKTAWGEFIETVLTAQ